MVPIAALQPAILNQDDYYTPSLERVKAIHNTSPTDFLTARLPKVNRKEESWFRQLVRLPSLEDLNPPLRSTHWKVPDAAHHLTSLSSHSSLPLLAIGSGGKEKNLYVYELAGPNGQAQLFHRQTVSLPYILSLQWSPAGLFTSQTVIATSHRNGLVHIVALPDSSNPQPARILRRFNFNPDKRQNLSTLASRVSHVEFAGAAWTCVPDATLLSLYGDTVYVWDATRNDRPLLTQKVATATTFHSSPFRDGIVSLSGAFGISLLDVRCRNRGLLRPKTANHSESTAVRWSPYNSNWVASAHEDSKIRVWDIRASKPFAELSGHLDIINSLEWSASDPNELMSGSTDQTINVWDVSRSSFAYDPSRSKEKYFSNFESKKDDATVISPEHSSRRRRALFTILEDPTNVTADEKADGVCSYRQSSAVLGLSSLDTCADGKSFSSITTDCQVGLHQVRKPALRDPVKQFNNGRKENDFRGGMILAQPLGPTSSYSTLS
ncbi:WD40-repeat-containing domain protein [Lipomyces oligophaga]|uniref:WD40-repeat-containing domain protein n=1 Tax=Lipomyces oligophaga TaxID=45792 RepID=UPI0034CDFCF1